MKHRSGHHLSPSTVWGRIARYVQRRLILWPLEVVENQATQEVETVLDRPREFLLPTNTIAKVFRRYHPISQAAYIRERVQMSCL
jgi:hypothetical protein